MSRTEFHRGDAEVAEGLIGSRIKGSTDHGPDSPAGLRARGRAEVARILERWGPELPVWHSALAQADWEAEAALVERENEERARFAAGLCPQLREIYLEGFEKPCLVRRVAGNDSPKVEPPAGKDRGRDTALRGPLWMVPEIVKDELALASIEVADVLDINHVLWTAETWERHRVACERLERAVEAVREVVRRSHVVPHQGRRAEPLHRWSKLSIAERARVVEMRRDGWKYREIAEALERPIGTIQSVLRRAG